MENNRFIAPSCVYDQAFGNFAKKLSGSAMASVGATKPAVVPTTRTIASAMEGSLRDKFRLGSMPTIGAIPSASEGGIVLFSPAYYAACAVGGILSCGGTHTLVTPRK